MTGMAGTVPVTISLRTASSASTPIQANAFGTFKPCTTVRGIMTFPARRTLIDIVVDGKPIKAVAQVGKQAFTYVFDRITGEPVWPIEEKPVSTDGAPGEVRSPTQPFPTKPPAFDQQGISEDDLIDFTPELRAEALEIVKDFVIGPIYTPTIVRGANGKDGSIQVPGLTGGANLFGASFDPETNLFFVKSMTLPSVTALAPGDPSRGDVRYPL